MKKYKVIFMIVVSLMLILSACSNDKDEKGSNIKQSKSKNELNLSSGDDIPTMDPSLAADQVSFTTFAQTL